jgi:hypothetical protein
MDLVVEIIAVKINELISILFNTGVRVLFLFIMIIK